MNLHENISTGFVNITDITSRTFTNDFFINSFYFLWTSFWYIPTFLSVLLILFILHSGTSSRPTTPLVILIILLILSYSYQNLNPHNYLNDSFGENFNILLSNSINKFHPALFYLTLLLITSYRPVSDFTPRNTYSSPHTHLLVNYYTLTTVPIIIFTLSLGSWWALQEGSWGGWWNWDPSEVFGLLVMLLHLNNIHRKVTTMLSNLPWLLVLFVYTFIQFNFDLVSHNFGTRVDQFIDSSHNFLFILFIVLLLTMAVYLRHRTALLGFHTTYKSNTVTYSLQWSLVLYLLLVFIVSSSFTLLLNDFFWKVLQINIFNTSSLVHYFTIVTLTLLAVRTWSPTLIIPGVCLLMGLTVQGNLIYSLSLTYTPLSTFHFSLVTTLCSMSDELNQSLSLWSYMYESASTTRELVVSDVFYTTVALNNFFIEYTTPFLVNMYVPEWFWNIIWSSSSTENHSFVHPTTTYTLSQELYSGTDLTPYRITVSDLAITATAIIYFFLFVAMSLLVNIKNRIIL